MTVSYGSQVVCKMCYIGVRFKENLTKMHILSEELCNTLVIVNQILLTSDF